MVHRLVERVVFEVRGISGDLQTMTAIGLHLNIWCRCWRLEEALTFVSACSAEHQILMPSHRT